MIQLAATDNQIFITFEVMRQLRPQLTADLYVQRIRQLMSSDNFHLAYFMEDDIVRVVAGFRFADMLYCGRLLSVDDLVAEESARSRGYGAQMLDWLKEQGRKAGCAEMQLVSRVIREQAHRFYFRQGMGIDCFHFRIAL